MHDSNSQLPVLVIVGVLLVLTAGCASTGGEKVAPSPVRQQCTFPPQGVLQSGDYAGFLKENQEILKTCKDPDQCSVALFNLGFLYSYSKSPYFNPHRGILYLEDLIKAAPESPQAYEARVWVDLMRKGLPRVVKRRPTREELKKEAAAAQARQAEAQQQESQQETQQQEVLQTQEVSVKEADRQQLETEIRNRDDTIRELNRQLERSRQIDIDIERKQRHLPY